jgi:hypothetical protein
VLLLLSPLRTHRNENKLNEHEKRFPHVNTFHTLNLLEFSGWKHVEKVVLWKSLQKYPGILGFLARFCGSFSDVLAFGILRISKFVQVSGFFERIFVVRIFPYVSYFNFAPHIHCASWIYCVMLASRGPGLASVLFQIGETFKLFHSQL